MSSLSSISTKSYRSHSRFRTTIIFRKDGTTYSEPSQEYKSKSDLLLTFTILFSISIVWTLSGNFSAFYAPYRTKMHPSISDTKVGIVMA